MSTPTFNLTLPVYSSNGRHQYRWMTDAERIAHGATKEARTQVLIGLFRAISPELAEAKLQTGAWRDLFSFRIGAYQPQLSIREMKTGQLEARLECGYGSRHNTFRRFKVDPKTGVIDPRIVEGVRELVAAALRVVQWEADSKVTATRLAEQKAAAFAHSETVIAAAGLGWRYPAHNSEGSLDLPGSYNRATVKGRTVEVELKGLDINQLPALVAFLKGLPTEEKTS